MQFPSALRVGGVGLTVSYLLVFRINFKSTTMGCKRGSSHWENESAGIVPTIITFEI